MQAIESLIAWNTENKNIYLRSVMKKRKHVRMHLEVLVRKSSARLNIGELYIYIYVCYVF